MSKLIATQKAVYQAAQDLVNEGIEPSIILIQERTGGSYTTVKKWFELWLEERQAHNANLVELPAEFEVKAREFARVLYSSAVNQAHSQAKALIADAQAEAQRAGARLSGAEAEVKRLERAEQEHLAEIAAGATKVHELELRSAANGATMEAQATRIAQLEAALEDARALRAASDQELAALRAQIADMGGLQAMLQPMQAKLDALAPNGRKAKQQPQ